MKKLGIDGLVFVGNIGLLFILQIASQFVVFFLYGEGASVDKQYNVWPIIFAIIQIIILTILYANKVLYKEIIPLIISIISVILLIAFFYM